MSTTVSLAGLGYVYWLVAARELDPASVGFATACIGAFGALSYVGSMGVQSTCLRLLPDLVADPEAWNEFFTAALLYPSLVATALCGVGAAVLGTVFRHYANLLTPGTFCLFLVGAFATSISLAVDACFISLRRSGRQFVRNALFGSIKLIVLVGSLALVSRGTADIVVLSWVAGVLVSSVLVVLLLLRPVRPSFRLALGGRRALLGEWRLMVGYQLTGLGGLLPNYLFPVVVVAVLGDAQNAYFYYTWSIGFIFFMVSASIAQALFSESVNTSQMAVQVKKAVKLIALLLAPVAVGVYVFGGDILSLFGPTYRAHGTGLLRICVISSVPDAITNVYVTILSVTRRVAEAAVINLFMAVVSISGAALLLPLLGINAVGWSWLIAQSLGSVGAGLMLLRGSSRRSRPSSGMASTAPASETISSAGS